MIANTTPEAKLKMLWQVYTTFFEAMEHSKLKPSPGTQVLLGYLDDVLNQAALPGDFLDKLKHDVGANRG